MRRLALAALAAALACGCATPRSGVEEGTGARGARHRAAAQPVSRAVVYDKRVFRLSKNPDPDLEAGLEDMLTASYEAAARTLDGDKPLDIGFTYSMSPKGAVYPFSEVEVSCIMQEKYSHKLGPQLCGELYREFGARVRKAVAGKQQ